MGAAERVWGNPDLLKARLEFGVFSASSGKDFFQVLAWETSGGPSGPLFLSAF
jgi:hypothetical protein